MKSALEIQSWMALVLVVATMFQYRKESLRKIHIWAVSVSAIMIAGFILLSTQDISPKWYGYLFVAVLLKNLSMVALLFESSRKIDKLIPHTNIDEQNSTKHLAAMATIGKFIKTSIWIVAAITVVYIGYHIEVSAMTKSFDDGMALLKKLDFVAAQPKFQAYVAEVPGDIRGVSRLGECALQNKDDKTFRDCVFRLHEMKCNHAEVARYELLAQKAFADGDKSLALTYLDTASDMGCTLASKLATQVRGD